MKEIFDLKRFWALVRLHYRENLRLYLLTVGFMAIIALLCLTRGNPVTRLYFSVSPEKVKDFAIVYSAYHRVEMNTFWGMWVAFSVWFASGAFRNLNRREKAGGVLLLPASNVEKFLLPFLNTTVVLGVVWLAVFYGVDWLVAHYKYGFYVFTGGDETLALSDAVRNNEIFRPALRNVFDLSEMRMPDKMSAGMMLSWMFTGVLFVQSLFMLGGLLFKRQPVLLTFVLQSGVFIAIVYISYLILRSYSVTLDKLGYIWINNEQIKMVILQVNPTTEHFSAILRGMYLGVLFPICYFWGTFQKLRETQG